MKMRGKCRGFGKSGWKPAGKSERFSRGGRDRLRQGRFLQLKISQAPIALVENDLMVGMAAKLALESCNMSVTQYSTAEEALADAGLEDADFYISDLRLPGLSGIEFLNTVQRRSMKSIKAVVMTGDPAVNRIELVESTPWQVLFKPVDLKKLLTAIETQDSAH